MAVTRFYDLKKKKLIFEKWFLIKGFQKKLSSMLRIKLVPIMALSLQGEDLKNTTVKNRKHFDFI